jgi:tetratricopeptide (TPR) repeat protein
MMADRYTYLPYIGLILPLAFPLDDPRGSRLRRLATPALAVALALLSVFCLWATRARCDVWQNSETLWSDTIRKYPSGSADAYINRGLYYQRVAQRPDLALADYDRALALNPHAPTAWNNRGRILAERGERDSAIASFDRAIALRPEFADVWNNRGGQKLLRGDLEGGVRDISRAIALDPRFWDAYANRAVGFGMQGNYDASIADCLRLIELQPDHPDVQQYYGLMGSSYLTLGKYREAIAALDKAILLAPVTEPRRRDYYIERSRAWGELGNRERERDDALAAERLGRVR